MAAVGKPVLLGLRDAAIRGCPQGPAAWTASKLGGLPDALPAVPAPEPRCGRCAELLALVVQVYCPLEGSPFHRLLHVFACARCYDNGPHSWKVFRSQCLQEPERETQDAQGSSLAAENWCEGSEDWGSDGEEEEEAPPSPPTSSLGNGYGGVRTVFWSTEFQAVCVQDNPPAAVHPFPKGDGLTVPQFQPYYICVAEEDDYGDAAGLDHARSLLRDYQQREGVDVEHLLSLCSSDGDEKYEKTKLKNGDETFYKFMKRIAPCQEQILRHHRIQKTDNHGLLPMGAGNLVYVRGGGHRAKRRYSWGGEPLFFTCPTSEVSDIPPCSGCGGLRTFEFQLMPALISMLRGASPGLTVEFGTILVYTCEQSCWPSNQQAPMEEFCIVQEDPDASLK